MKVTIYTDGSSLGNPGPGGYGAVLMSEKGHYKELSAGFRKTTNNRMELMAVIMALTDLKSQAGDVLIYSDSKYVVDAIAKGWLTKWLKKGLNARKNADLWRMYLNISTDKNLEYAWVKGHAGNKFNERCDELAVAAANGKNLPPDEGYEKLQKRLLF